MIENLIQMMMTKTTTKNDVIFAEILVDVSIHL